MMYLFDLGLVLGIAAFVIFCFMEIGLVWGLVSLVAAIAILLVWIQSRTELFG
ncbi:MAG: hypothetical protein NTU58_00425 [Candidatus Nealsonbacteria bacterium]|nr:hypothetical protein [Candidatus Nealsonbacteria bacterium]